MNRDISGFKKKQMTVASKVLVTPSILTGEGLRDVAVFGNDRYHSIVGHSAPHQRVPNQIREHHCEIAAHFPTAVLPNAFEKAYAS
jgi:hypothetical protein